jgi:hypothetical protein
VGHQARESSPEAGNRAKKNDGCERRIRAGVSITAVWQSCSGMGGSCAPQGYARFLLVVDGHQDWHRQKKRYNTNRMYQQTKQSRIPTEYTQKFKEG